MNKTKHQTRAAKAREKWLLLQEEQKVQNKKSESQEETIPLKVAHNSQKTNDALADSA